MARARAANHNPRSASFVARDPIKLPPLAYMESPNKSARQAGVIPYLVVVHRPVGTYGPSISWLRNPDSDASAHVITEGRGSGVDVATQLVPWDQKSWSCVAFNTASYNVEVDDDGWDGDDWGAFFSGAHVVAWICHKTGIPPVWTHDPLHKAGVIRHLDLGVAGGGHSDPTTDVTIWKNFVKQVKSDVQHTSWRKTWGKGKLTPIRGR
jgi:hypothetical protein